MASKVDICNMALSRIGSKVIQSLGDNTTEAKTLNIIYDQVAENVMSMGPWTSCTFRTTLAQTTNTPEYGYSYEYQLPTNPKIIRTLEVNECKLGDIEYRIEGDKLLTDEPTIQIKYLGYITNTEAYDPYLRQAITERLIVEMAYNKTGNERALTNMEQLFAAKVESWLNLNNTQGSSQTLPSDEFIDIRNGN